MEKWVCLTITITAVISGKASIDTVLILMCLGLVCSAAQSK
jgi:hypothetical protein